MRVIARPPRGYPGGHRHVQALHRARNPALRSSNPRARRDRSRRAVAPTVCVRADLARALAGSYLAGQWNRAGLLVSGAEVVGRRARWLGPLARQVLELYPRPPLDRPRELADLIRTRPAAERAAGTGPIRHPLAGTRMVRNPWRLVALHDLVDLRDLFGLTGAELDWFSDRRRWARLADSPMQHYRHSSRVAPSGAIRVLEAPKPRLKWLQRQLLADLLSKIPTHQAAHGFRSGRSVASFAAPHAGQQVLVRMDLEGFFAAVGVGRVYGIFRTAGYPEPVAHALAGLTTRPGRRRWGWTHCREFRRLRRTGVHRLRRQRCGHRQQR